MKRFLPFIILIITLIGIVVGVVMMKQRQDIRNRAAPATTLTFSPQSITKQTGQTFTMDVAVNTGSNTLTAVDLTVNSDPTQVKITSITGGTYLPTVLKAGSVTDGQGKIILGVSAGSPKQGTGTVATVTFQTVGTTGSSQITLVGSQAAGVLEGSNIISQMGTATVTILGATSTVGPTPTPTTLITQTTTMAPSVTVTPTVDLGATFTPTPTIAVGSDTNITITSPADGSTITTNTPTISGTAPPGSAVTITVHAEGITGVVTAQSNGQWSIAVTQPLADGSHSVVASYMTEAGATGTRSNAFTINTQTTATVGEPLPVSGPSIMVVLVPVMSALLLIGLGLVL